MSIERPIDRIENRSSETDFNHHLQDSIDLRHPKLSIQKQKQANSILEDQGILPKFADFNTSELQGTAKVKELKPQTFVALRGDDNNSLNPDLNAKDISNDVRFMSLKQNRNVNDLEKYLETRLNEMARKSPSAARETAAKLDCSKILNCDSLGHNDARRDFKLRLDYDGHAMRWSARIVEKPPMPIKVEPISRGRINSRPRASIELGTLY